MNAVNEAAVAIAAPAIGEYWPGQGGIYAGIMPGEDGQRPYHLIVSATDVEDVAYGGYGSKVPGADSRYDGAANTRALLAATTEHPAAKWASEYSADGHTDFHLPAQRELNLCYATIPHKFEKDWYWSSTQETAGYAWFQLFGNGGQLYGDELSKLRAVAVRRLFI
ncbi:DUF1566 domain-containing protein [Paraburkholderia sp. SOS3]|uniref:DUF1566 domain-containing protein n=1 Tax=Paraburkholderia sp. SOS3 TaxID=1926494 RepID=UPI00094776A2|nr:DUF1566 domain-containing protein [Paraburkholderia sp. SOS3]APR40467.1 hypothetical protein BTO02_33180 [Paraburkholderia sp. SOS3]